MVFLDSEKMTDALGELVRVIHDEYPCVLCFDLHDAVVRAIEAVIRQSMEDGQKDQRQDYKNVVLARAYGARAKDD